MILLVVGIGQKALPTFTHKTKHKNNMRKNVESIGGIEFQKFECFGVGSSPYL